MDTRSTVKSRGSAPSSGRTNGRACISCHQRKIRCDILDRGAPCTNCRSHERPGCRVYEKKKHRIPQARGPVPIRPRESHVSPPVPIAAVAAAPGAPPLTSDPEENEPGNLAEFIDQEDVRSGEIGQHSRSCFIGTGISNFNYLVRQSSLHPGAESVFHFGNRQFHPKYTSHDLQHVPSDAVQRVDPKLEQRLLNAYFHHVNRGWPIVSEEGFRQSMTAGSKNPLSLPLLNSILLVGAHVLAYEDQSMQELQAVFFRRAKTLIDCRFDQDRTVYVQVALLLTWYSDGLEEVVANAWHWIGIATRTALGCGMHRDVTRNRMLPENKAVWTRLWWVLFQFDTMVSASYGRPQALWFEESDVPELEPSHFDGMPNAEVDFVIQHSKLCKIISKANQERWTLRATAETRIKATQEADEALAYFTVQLPQTLHLSTQNPTVWQSTLHLTYNNFLILLHRPAPNPSDRDEVSEACSDSAICGGATTTISSICDSLLHHGGFMSIWLYGIHALFTAIVHVGSELASPNPLVSVKAQKTFASLIAALRVQAPHWRFALGLLRLFEQRAIKLKLPSAATSPGEYAGPQKALQGRNDDEEFSLRPPPADPSVSQSASWDQDTNNMESGNPSLIANGAQYPGPYRLEEARPFGYQGATMAGDDMFLPDFSFPDASALEFFLADMEGSLQDPAWSVEPSG